MKVAGTLMERGIKTVDLSADYRLARDVFEKTYVCPRCLLRGPLRLTELHREEVRGASFVANPAASRPGRRSRRRRSRNMPTPSSTTQRRGIGRRKLPSATTHYPNVGDNFSAYKWTSHRHLAER
jgi:N-acetyl-gamma-glutamyl-phosphate reductase